MTAESVPTRWAYSPDGFARRCEFAAAVEAEADERGIEVEWTSPEKWTAVLRRGGVAVPLYGYVFPLNSAAASKVMDDKSDTHAVLTAGGVPSVPHLLLSPHRSDGTTVPAHVLAQVALSLCGGAPLVIKPNRAVSGGSGVQIVDSADGVEGVVTSALAAFGSAACSPYINGGDFDEYRTIVLDGEALLTYRKVRAPGERLHNLKHGAAAEDVTDSEAYLIESLAVMALAAVGGRFASVDTVRLPGGRLGVLELNDGVALGYYARRSLLADATARRVYGLALDAVFDPGNGGTA